MDESGVRHRFGVRFEAKEPTHYPEEMRRLAHWCRVFDEEGLAPVLGGASAGNLSFRTPAGYVITASRTRLKTGIDWRDFVEVVGEELDVFVLRVRGAQVPSSDSFLHGRIYAARPDVTAVFHGHDDRILERAGTIGERFGVRVTPSERPFGTIEDAVETAAALGGSDFVIRRGHGFVSAGRTLDEAGDRALEIHRFAARV